MFRLALFLLLLTFFSLSSTAQEPFRVMFYNVENLYDTINNPKVLDDDFTPSGNLHWNGYRYKKKLEDISKVIGSLGGQYPPVLVGLAEVENQSVLSDLTKHSSLARHRYAFVVTDSKDIRGSNVALLYQRDQFQFLQKNTYTPIIDSLNRRTTRDILHVMGKVVNGDTLDVFVCHFPSRSEGVRKTAPYRKIVAEVLRSKVDNLFKVRGRANIIIMGDFNDYPKDASLREVLKAKEFDASFMSRSNLYNLFSVDKLSKEDVGSYRYRGKWGYLDQILISENLLKSSNPLYVLRQEANVYAPDFLLEEDLKHGGQKPFRTYSGWTYLGGTSDHLPVYIDLYVDELE